MNIKRISSTTDDEKIKWDLFQRLRLLELTAYWEGRLTTKHLRNAFGIGRVQASRDINYYLQRFPDNLVYDKYLKGYLPTETFKAKFSNGSAEQYLDILKENKEVGKQVIGICESDTPLEVVGMPPRHTDPAILQTLMFACRNEMRVDVMYASQGNPDDREGRIIAPHTIVNSGYRWHVRAYCEQNRDYRDFVLSRFLEVPEIESKRENNPDEDKHWNKIVTIELIPHPKLSRKMKLQICKERGMVDGVLKQPSRAALVPYQLMHMQIPTYKNPEVKANPVVVGNLDELEDYFWK